MLEGPVSALTVSLQELERTVVVVVPGRGLAAALEEREHVELSPAITVDEEWRVTVTPWLAKLVGIAGGVMTVDHETELGGLSGMLSVTSTVEVWLGPSGNVRVTTVVASLPKVSRTVTVSVDAATAGAVTVVTEMGEFSEIAAWGIDSAGKVSVTAGISAVLVDKTVNSVIVAVWRTDSPAEPEQVELLTSVVACESTVAEEVGGRTPVIASSVDVPEQVDWKISSLQTGKYHTSHATTWKAMDFGTALTDAGRLRPRRARPRRRGPQERP